MNRKELISVVLIVALTITSVPPKAVEASWFSDFFGAVFTFITAPLQLVAPDNPTLRKNNPFRKKAWEVEPEPFVYKPLVPHHTPKRSPESAPPQIIWSTVTFTVEVEKEVVKEVPVVRWSTVTFRVEVEKEVEKIVEVPHWSTVTVNSASLVPPELKEEINLYEKTIKSLKNKISSKEALKYESAKRLNESPTNNNYKASLESLIDIENLFIEKLHAMAYYAFALARKNNLKGKEKECEEKMEENNSYGLEIKEREQTLSELEKQLTEVNEDIEAGKGLYHYRRNIPIAIVSEEANVDGDKQKYATSLLEMEGIEFLYKEQKKKFQANKSCRNYLDKVAEKRNLLISKKQALSRKITLLQRQKNLSSLSNNSDEVSSYEKLIDVATAELAVINAKMPTVDQKYTNLDKFVKDTDHEYVFVGEDTTGNWNEASPLDDVLLIKLLEELKQKYNNNEMAMEMEEARNQYETKLIESVVSPTNYVRPWIWKGYLDKVRGKLDILYKRESLLSKEIDIIEREVELAKRDYGYKHQLPFLLTDKIAKLRKDLAKVKKKINRFRFRESDSLIRGEGWGGFDFVYYDYGWKWKAIFNHPYYKYYIFNNETGKLDRMKMLTSVTEGQLPIGIRADRDMAKALSCLNESAFYDSYQLYCKEAIQRSGLGNETEAPIENKNISKKTAFIILLSSMPVISIFFRLKTGYWGFM